MFGNRAIYHDGWFAGTVHKAPWEFSPRNSLENDKWELYDTRVDFSLADDLAAKQPEKLKELLARGNIKMGADGVMHRDIHACILLKEQDLPLISLKQRKSSVKER
jgi:arylsulfatase A-like enzyme